MHCKYSAATVVEQNEVLPKGSEFEVHSAIGEKQAVGMRREGRVRGKLSNKSRVTGRKHRDRWKEPDDDVRVNPELRLKPSLQYPRRQMSSRGLVNRALDQRSSAGAQGADEDAVQKEKATVNTVIEEAIARMDDGYGDGEDQGETTAMACIPSQIASGTILAEDGADVMHAIEEAFHRDLGIYENAVEGSNFSETHFVRRWGAVLSEESWSDIEILESELESSEDDDDWCMVDDEGDDV